MMNSGSAMMGIGRASGENRAAEAAAQAISSPLLEETIHGATGVILNITGGEDLSLHEVHAAADVIYGAVDPDANILFGSVINPDMKDQMMVTVIATGFKRDGVISKHPIAAVVETPVTETVSEDTAIDEATSADEAAPVVKKTEPVVPQRRGLFAFDDSIEEDVDLDVPSFLRHIS
jgi:cell division protein FtsZ